MSGATRSSMTGGAGTISSTRGGGGGGVGSSASSSIPVGTWQPAKRVTPSKAMSFFIFLGLKNKLF